MGEFSDLVKIRNEYYEYTDEVCDIIQNETTAINEVFLGDLLKSKVLKCLDSEYPLTSIIVLRLTHNEIVEIITDETFVNIRTDIIDKIVTRLTGKSAIMTHYTDNGEGVKRRRAMANMIRNYMYSMYMSDSKSSIPLMEEGLYKAIDSFDKSEDCIKNIEISSNKSHNPKQGIIFTITLYVE